MTKKIIKVGILIILIGKVIAQPTNPSPQSLPYSQNFGTSTFSTLPNGFAGWNGMSGASITTQAQAESSVPTGNATVNSATAIQTTGGMYGYSDGSNAKVYVQTSSNATNGVNQLALAINTVNKTNINISYSISMISSQPRIVGCILQWRVGTSGSWTTVSGSVFNSSTQPSGATYSNLTLPSDVEDQSNIQLRWAIWRGTESGSSSGIGIDNISITSESGSTNPPSTPTLVSPADNATGLINPVQLIWNSAQYASTYRVRVALDTAFSSLAKDTSGVNDTTLAVNGLQYNSTPYYWKVTAVNSNGESTSTRRSFVMAQNPPSLSIPTLLGPTNNSKNLPKNVTLNWTAVNEATAYDLQISTSQTFSPLVLDSLNIPNTRCTVPGLSFSTSYYWRVRATNAYNTSSYSASKKFTTIANYSLQQQVLFPGISGQYLLDSLVAHYYPDRVLGYDTARDTMYGEVYKVNDSLKCVYAGGVIYITPDVSPRSEASSKNFNAEHTYPQNKGASTGFPNSDMHHITPTYGPVNNARSNYPFAEIPDSAVTTWYRLFSSTSTKPTQYIDEYSRYKSNTSFQPRKEHKGNTARMVFYFYTMYKTQADAADTDFFNIQKEYLYQWHYQDTVDSLELIRSWMIQSHQGNINPFILDTTLVRRAYFEPDIVPVELERFVFPKELEILQNYPNPFNPTTAISYHLPAGQAGLIANSHTQLKIFDILGREVATLVNGKQSAGCYVVQWNASEMPSGTYFAQLKVGNVVKIKKLMLVR